MVLSVLRLSPKVLRIETDVRGLENIDPAASYVYMPNHCSLLDGPLLVMLIPQTVRAIIKVEAFRIPVVGLGLRHLGFVPVDRKGAKAGAASVKRAADLMKRKNYSFLIFPEGTRSLDGRLQRFRRGGFFLALESGAAIVPVAISGTFKLMPKKSLFVRPGRIRVTFCPPVGVTGCGPDDIPVLTERVRTAILNAGREEAR